MEAGGHEEQMSGGVGNGIVRAEDAEVFQPLELPV